MILATDGFEWNDEYKRAFLRGPLTHPVSIETNTGDGLYLAMKAGAMLANIWEAWWIPVGELLPGVNRMNRFLLSGDRSRPPTVIVNRAGRRFANEAANYNAFGGAFHQEDVARFEYSNLPCWLLFDAGYVRTYGSPGTGGAGVRGAGEDVADYLISAPTLAGLAGELGIPASELEATVERWNKNVAEGHDPDFGRGGSAHDRWWGDQAFKGTVQATLGPIDEGPFLPKPCRCRAGPWAPRAVPRWIPTPGCSTSTAIRSPACTRGRVPLRHDLRWRRGHARAGHGLRLAGRHAAG